MSVETSTAAPAEVMSRNEKKAWKALQKFNLEAVDDIVKVEIRRPKAAPIVVDAPKVYRTAGHTPTFVIMGAPRVHNAQQEWARTYRMFAQQQALLRAQQAAAANKAEAGEQTSGATVEPVQSESTPAEAEVDTTGLDEGDIKMAIEQTGKSKKAVVEALRAHDGDLVETIMALTS